MPATAATLPAVWAEFAPNQTMCLAVSIPWGKPPQNTTLGRRWWVMIEVTVVHAQGSGFEGSC